MPIESNKTKQVLMIVPCEAHTEAVMGLLDESHVDDWVVLPAAQARREGRLEYVPPISEHSCDVILAMAGEDAVEETLRALEQIVHEKELCPNCLAYIWQARRVLLGHPALDPVCEMEVDVHGAPSLVHEGVRYYFCSEECLERFRNNPGAYARSFRTPT